MNRFLLGAASTALTTVLVSNVADASRPLPDSALQQYAEAAQRNVIVVLRDQIEQLPPLRRSGARAQALLSAQNSLLGNWPQLKGRHFHSFSTINAFATRVTASEAAQLKAHPAVKAVVDDAIIAAPKRPEPNSPAGLPGAVGDGKLCNTLEPEALQVTNTAFLDTSVPQAQTLRDGNGQLLTGKGVKVAFLADGLDPNIKGFSRADGSKVFIDYQDFSGDPAGTPTGGGEAFGDASSIAANDVVAGKPLSFDISKYVNAAHPLPSGCNIRVRGMAPGASLVGLKVFGAQGATFSTYVQAIEYAVLVDDVDVINESLGTNSLPPSINPLVLANRAAVRAGVVVTESSGDAGPGTLDDEGAEDAVISVGGTTTFRAYAQTGDAVIPLLAQKSYLNNNISALSSSGISSRRTKTIDVVAPGEVGWALCSTDVKLYEECLSLTSGGGAPSPIEVFGGTSESSPLVAGEAALIIQAYRSTHRGSDPSPALVKQIIMSTSTDLGAPTQEQGAGLINSLAAVNAALSIDGPGYQPRSGASLLAQPTSAGVTDDPGAEELRVFTVTNNGSSAVHLAPALEALAPAFRGETLTVKSDPATEPRFINVAGAMRAYATQTFNVPGNADHLDASVAFKNPLDQLASNPPLLLLALVDPKGRLAAYSAPQGLGSGYGHVDVVSPKAGQWTAVIYTRIPGVAGSYSGPVQFSWSAQRFESVGSVFPARFDLPPGATMPLFAQFSMPGKPGDLSAAIRFEHSPGAENATFPAIPVSLRTLVPMNAHGGSFEGTLTGGNGRAGTGPQQVFKFDVPAGIDNLGLSFKTSDPGYLLEGLLVDPNGMQLSVAPNLDAVDGSATAVMELYHNNPQPGRWSFILLQNFASSGNQTSLPFKSVVSFNSLKISAPTLPNGAQVMLSASAKPMTVAVKVVNNGSTTQQYFADGRLSGTTLMSLPPLQCGDVTTIPGTCGLFLLPTQTSEVSFVGQSTVPINMSAANAVGFNVGGTFNPNVFAKPASASNRNTAIATVSAPELPYSFWSLSPALIGPFGPAGAPNEPFAAAAFAHSAPFDTALSADSGDLWSDVVFNTNTFNPLVLAPGESGVITLTITPDPKMVGQTVSGYVYVDTFNPQVSIGDELVRIPYSYTVAP